MNLITNVSPLLPPLTGIGHYTRQLLLELQAMPEIGDIKGVSALRWHDRDAVVGMLNDVSAGSKGETEEKPASLRHKEMLLDLGRMIPFARRLKRSLEQRTAQKMSSLCEDYIYWEPNYTLLPLDNPSAVTVHDLSHIHFPQYHPKERVDILHRTLEESLLKATRVIAVSEYTRQDITRHFAVPAERIDVVSPAVCNSFRVKVGEPELTQVRKKYKLPNSYLLSVATLEPRKNILGLVKAFSQLPQSSRQAFPLVLVGTKGWLTEELESALDPLLRKGEAIRLGYVDQADLPLIYAGATCMAYVSFFEGYGMPVAEAMTSGTPVLTSNVSSMPEVAAEATLLVDPYDVSSITVSLQQLIEDEGLHSRLREAGLKASQSYTWSNSAQRLLSVLQQVK